MTVVYTDVDTFTNPISLIDDSDAPNAANSNVGPKGIANRTRYLNTRLIATLTDPSSLTAITTMVDGDTRDMAGWGFYVYRSASTEPVDNLLVVNGHSSVGRWLQLDYAQQTMRLVASETINSQTNRFLNIGSPDAADPATRSGGTTAYSLVTLSTSFDFRANDMVVFSYAIPFTFSGAGNTSDACFGVSLRVSGSDLYPIELLENSAQVTASSAPGVNANGIVYSSTSTMAVRAQISKTVSYRFAGSRTPCTVILVGGTNAHASGEILQGVTLSVAQYRTSR